MAKKTEIVAMPKAEAQRLVKEILADATNLAAKLRELRERQGWRSLGYKTWADCVKEEFGYTKRYANVLIQADEVRAQISQVGSIDPTSPPTGGTQVETIISTSALSVAQARELFRLPEEQRKAAWQDTLDRAERMPTAQDVKETVDLYLADNEAPDEAGEPDDEAPWTPDDDDEPVEPTTEERMVQAARALAALSRAIQAHAKEAEALNDPHLDDIRLQILKSQLRAAGGTLLACRGVQVCKCVRGCKSCRKSGWLTKDVAEVTAE